MANWGNDTLEVAVAMFGEVVGSFVRALHLNQEYPLVAKLQEASRRLDNPHKDIVGSIWDAVQFMCTPRRPKLYEILVSLGRASLLR